jgi:hypothetical protein
MLVDPALVTWPIRRLHPKNPPSEPRKLVGRAGWGQAKRKRTEGGEANSEKKENQNFFSSPPSILFDFSIYL